MLCLLTGSSGFLGKVIRKNLSTSIQVRTLSRSYGDYMVELDKVIPKFNNRFEIVIHAAGLAHVSKEINTDTFNNVNVLGTQNLLRGLELSGIPEKFVLISSVSVYGVQSGASISEKCKLMANDAYGRSKRDAEKLVFDWCKEHNVICTILRLPLVVGASPPGNLASMINGIRVNVYFNIAGGKARKSMVLAQDVAKHILKAAEVGGIYNLTDGYHPSFCELSKNIALQLGKREPRNLPLVVAKFVAMMGSVLGRRSPINSEKLSKITSDLTFDDSKARDAFGWNPTPVLEGFKLFDID